MDTPTNEVDSSQEPTSRKRKREEINDLQVTCRESKFLHRHCRHRSIMEEQSKDWGQKHKEMSDTPRDKIESPTDKDMDVCPVCQHGFRGGDEKCIRYVHKGCCDQWLPAGSQSNDNITAVLDKVKRCADELAKV